MQFKPVNLGDSRHGGAYRPSRSMSPLAHWNRDNEPDFQKVIDGLDTTATAAAVFDNLEAAEQCTKAVREADLGLSINISTSVDGAIACCNAAGIHAPQRGYSLGFEGKTEHLPNGDVLALSTMCGHGMVSHVAREEDDRLGEGRPPDARTGFGRAEPVLLVRGVQSVARDAAAGRGAGADEVRRRRPDAPHRARHRRRRLRRRRAAGAPAPAPHPRPQPTCSS